MNVTEVHPKHELTLVSDYWADEFIVFAPNLILIRNLRTRFNGRESSSTVRRREKVKAAIACPEHRASPRQAAILLNEAGQGNIVQRNVLVFAEVSNWNVAISSI